MSIGETQKLNIPTLVDKQNISYEYIRGLAEGEGCFTFYTANFAKVNGNQIKRKIPAFAIRMHERDTYLLEAVKEKLGLRVKIYNFKPNTKDGHKRGRTAALIVRGVGNLKNIIVPLFYNKLIGNKGRQFNEWLEKIGNDPAIHENYKIIYRLHQYGYYSKNNKYASL